jgi:hypothetical protein
MRRTRNPVYSYAVPWVRIPPFPPEQQNKTGPSGLFSFLPLHRNYDHLRFFPLAFTDYRSDAPSTITTALHGLTCWRTVATSPYPIHKPFNRPLANVIDR